MKNIFQETEPLYQGTWALLVATINYNVDCYGLLLATTETPDSDSKPRFEIAIRNRKSGYD